MNGAHPHIPGLVLACIGLSITTHSAERLVLTGGLAALLSFKAGVEEKALVEKYGAEYESYRSECPTKVLPGVDRLFDWGS